MVSSSGAYPSLDRDYEQQRQQRELSTLFKAHLSPAFRALVRQNTDLDSPGNDVSLATCEKVPTSDPAKAKLSRDKRVNNGDFDGSVFDTNNARGVPTVNSQEIDESDIDLKGCEYELVTHFSDAREAIQASMGRSRERQRRVLALIQVGEVSHAKRLANCQRKSVQLECPELAGGCGSDDNFQLITCDSRLCPTCQDRSLGQKANQYAAVVAGWDHPSMVRLSLPKRVDPTVEDLERGIDALRGAHGSLRRRVVPANGPGWSWGEWRSKLCMVGARDLARRWQKRYVDQGRGIPFKEVVPTGFYGIDLKQGSDGSVNVHMHILADIPWVPQAALSHLWDELIAAPVVDIRRIDGRGDQDAIDAILEVVAYAAKPPEWQTVEDEVAYFQALKGSKLVQPFGELHGNTPTMPGRLCCADCGQAPRWWHYKGIVDGAYQTMSLLGSSADGDRPPPT